MFGPKIINCVYNPLKVTKESLIEFKYGKYKDDGMFKFLKMIEVRMSDYYFTKYLVRNHVNPNLEIVIEVFQKETDLEIVLYDLYDTIPYDEDFLENAGGQIFTTEDEGIFTDYFRCVDPKNENRIDGTNVSIRVYDVQTNIIERIGMMDFWEYENETEKLNIEMLKSNGMFRIFKGIVINLNVDCQLYKIGE